MRAHTSSTDPPWPSSTQQLRQQGAEQPRGRLQQAAVSSPGNSLERQEGWPRPSWIRAISRVRGSLREQRGEGCEKLEEPMLVRARSRKIKVRAPGTGQRCTQLTHLTGRSHLRTATVQLENRFLTGPSRSERATARRARVLTVHVAPPPGPRTLDHILV